MPRRGGRAPITKARPYTPSRGRFAGQTFHTERSYRNALAQARGDASHAARERRGKQVRGPAELSRLRPAEGASRERALAALSLSRREDISLTKAARREGTTLNAIQKWARPALERDTRGHLRPKPFDRLYRPLRFWTPDRSASIGAREVVVPTRDSRTASTISGWHEAIKRYRQTGDFRAIARYRRRVIHVEKRGYLFLTDQAVIDYLLRAGALAYDSIYADIA